MFRINRERKTMTKHCMLTVFFNRSTAMPVQIAYTRRPHRGQLWESRLVLTKVLEYRVEKMIPKEENDFVCVHLQFDNPKRFIRTGTRQMNFTTCWTGCIMTIRAKGWRDILITSRVLPERRRCTPRTNTKLHMATMSKLLAVFATVV